MHPERIVEVTIPKKFQPWTKSANVPIVLRGDIVELPGKVAYRLCKTGQGYSVLQHGTNSPLGCVGEFDAHTVRRTVNDKISKHVSLIRAAVYEVSFPAPLAYLLPDYSVVHPGACYQQCTSVSSSKTLYYIKDDDARCAVCHESIL